MASVANSTQFEVLFFGPRQETSWNTVPRLAWLCGKVLALEWMNFCAQDAEKTKIFPHDIALHLKGEWLMTYLQHRVKNNLYQMEMEMNHRTKFFQVHDQILYESLHGNSLEIKNTATNILESYYSQSIYQLGAIPQTIYQRGMLGRQSWCKMKMSDIRNCTGQQNKGKTMSVWLKRLLHCQSRSRISLEFSSDPPKILKALEKYAVAIPQDEFAAVWSKGRSANKCVFDDEDGNKKLMTFPVSEEHPNYLAMVEMVAKRLVWSHKYFREWRFSECLAMLMCCWTPVEMIQKVDFFCLLVKLCAEIHVDVVSQCNLINLASQIVRDYKNEFKNQVLGASLLTCFLRWGHFNLMEEFYYRCFSPATSVNCLYEIECARKMAEGYAEYIENIFLYVCLYRMYHSNCSANFNQLSCVEKKECCTLFQEVENLLKKMSTVMRVQDHYMQGVYFFLKYVCSLLYFGTGNFEELKTMSKMHFVMSTEDESDLLLKVWSGERLDSLKFTLDREIDYHCVDLRLGRVLVKQFLMEVVSYQGICRGKSTSAQSSREREVIQDALKHYKAATQDRSYRMPLLQTAFNVFKLLAKHTKLQERPRVHFHSFNASFDESDVLMDSRTINLSESLCQINENQKKCIESLLVPNLQRLNGVLKNCTHLKALPANIDLKNKHSMHYFFISDPTVLGKHLFYGGQHFKQGYSEESYDSSFSSSYRLSSSPASSSQ